PLLNGAEHHDHAPDKVAPNGTTTGAQHAEYSAGATVDRVIALHCEHQARWSLRHRDQVEAGVIEENIASVAAIERVKAYATRVSHRRGPWYEQR
ncbi:hypothetical protein ACFWQK_16160, partial [Brachybacterium paraconglomeratum]